MRKGITKELINILEGKHTTVVDEEVLIEYAMKNKVLLHVLRALNINNSLRFEQERMFKTILRRVEEVSKALEVLDFTFYKLLKPVSYVPADIDILVKVNEVEYIVEKLNELGFKVVVKKPYTIIFLKNSLILDVYTHPTLGGVIYLNGQQLLRYKSIIEFNGLSIPSLNNYVEALISAIHSIYKEKIYTLNDYIAIMKWANQKTLELAEELKKLKAQMIREQVLLAKDLREVEPEYLVLARELLKGSEEKIQQLAQPLTPQTLTVEAKLPPEVGEALTKKTEELARKFEEREFQARLSAVEEALKRIAEVQKELAESQLKQ